MNSTLYTAGVIIVLISCLLPLLFMVIETATDYEYDFIYTTEYLLIFFAIGLIFMCIGLTIDL